VNIREINPSDTRAFTTLLKEVDESSAYMLWEPGERNLDEALYLKIIKEMNTIDQSTIFVAELQNELIGYLLAIGGNAKRNRHSAYLVIGIKENYRGKGIGTQLLKNVEIWARNNQMTRLELTVVTKNEVALTLYKKHGFEIEGTKRNSLYISGHHYDEYYMGKLL